MIQKQPIRIVSTEALTESQLEYIRSVSPRLEVCKFDGSPDGLPAFIRDAEVLFTHFRRTGFDPVLVPRLRWVQLTSASVEELFTQPIIKADIVFTNCSGIHGIPIAEYVLGSMLAFARHFPELFQRQRDGRWPTPEELYGGLRGSELRGRVLGVLGYGSIGREVARLAHSFGMSVLACKRDPTVRRDKGWYVPGTGDPDGLIPEAVYSPARLHEFLAACDYIVLCCPLTKETEKIIGEPALKAMRPNAYLVNVGRGKLVDEPALVQALKQGSIAGAGLDVTTIEPLPPESELFDLPNLILTPHLSGNTPMYMERATQLFADNLRRYLAGSPLLNIIDRQKEY